jgi:cell wall assembly regulator SMI1
MSIETMTMTIDAIQKKEVGTGASDDEIRNAEDLLGIQLPDDYEAFLHTYGWARLMYDEFYGVGRAVPKHLDLIANTMRERADFRPYMPTNLIPVMPDGAGNHYCLDVSRAELGKCPVVFWDHDQDEAQTPEIVAPSFSVWIVNHLQEQA